MFWKSNVNKIIFLVPLKYREIITVKPVTVSLKVLKARKRSRPRLPFIMSVKKYGWAIQKGLFA